MKKILIRVGLGIGALILIIIIASFFSIKSAQKDPPPLLTANFTDLDKIEKISRYRSCAGHVTVPQRSSESRRNMKHYFWVKPEYNKPQTVEIYSPYNGYVADIRSEPELGLEGEIWISPKKMLFMAPPFGVWSFSVQHIDIKPGLKVGDQVRAGELIGWMAGKDSFDIVYGKIGIPPTKVDNWTNPFADLDSVFSHMIDEVFAEYQQNGVSSREDFFISKEERDRNLCVYQGEGPYFEDQFSEDNWVLLR